jgi:predicted butyrate kinase (DUF1464 family)
MDSSVSEELLPLPTLNIEKASFFKILDRSTKLQRHSIPEVIELNTVPQDAHLSSVKRILSNLEIK